MPLVGEEFPPTAIQDLIGVTSRLEEGLFAPTPTFDDHVIVRNPEGDLAIAAERYWILSCANGENIGFTSRTIASS
jgi:hypothetical protein